MFVHIGIFTRHYFVFVALLVPVVKYDIKYDASAIRQDGFLADLAEFTRTLI